jgi:hypothetical protein
VRLVKKIWTWLSDQFSTWRVVTVSKASGSSVQLTS